jgi:hypothetical protein
LIELWGGMEISGPLPRSLFSWSQVERQQKSLFFFNFINILWLGTSWCDVESRTLLTAFIVKILVGKAKCRWEISTFHLGCAAHFRFRSKMGKCERKPCRLEPNSFFWRNRRTLLSSLGGLQYVPSGDKKRDRY